MAIMKVNIGWRRLFNPLYWLLHCLYSSVSFADIETLVVTAPGDIENRWAQAYLSQQQLPDGSADIGERLQGLSGLQVDSRSNYAQDTRLSLRGFGARSPFGVRGIQLQLDGIPLTMPDGQGQTSGLLLDDIEQVHIVSGPIAGLYGNAAGGVVQFYSVKPSNNRLALNIDADELGLSRQRLQLNLHNNNWGLRGSASQLAADGLRPHSEANKRQQAVQAFYEFDNNLQVKLRMDHEDSPLLQDPLGLTLQQWRDNPWQTQDAAEIFNTYKSIRHQQQSLVLSQLNTRQAWQLAAWSGDRDIRQYLALKGDAITHSGGIVDLSRQFSGATGNFNWYWQSWQLAIGASAATMRDNRKGYVNNRGIQGDLRRDEMNRGETIDGYALIQYFFSTRWHWLMGVRHSQVKLTVDDYYMAPGNLNDSGIKVFDHANSAVATIYQITDALKFHVAWGEGFETPTLAEIAYSPNDTGFNRYLDAASQRQMEIGFDYQFNGIVFTLNAFDVRSENEISVLSSNGGRTTYYNAQATRRHGLEWRWQVARKYWGLSTNANIFNSIFTQGTERDRQLPGIAKHQETLQAYWLPFDTQHLNLQLQALHRSNIAANDINSEFAPGFFRWDFAIQSQWQLSADVQLTGWGKVMNISDKPYVGSVIVNQGSGRSFEPAPGRTLATGLQLQYQF